MNNPAFKGGRSGWQRDEDGCTISRECHFVSVGTMTLRAVELISI